VGKFIKCIKQISTLWKNKEKTSHLRSNSGENLQTSVSQTVVCRPLVVQGGLPGVPQTVLEGKVLHKFYQDTE
jgi:hypothetical protein